MSNEWLERGELPPVGFTQNECELTGLCYERFSEFEVVAHVNGKAIIAVTKYTCGSSGVWANALESRFFKPIRTEREKVIEAAAQAFHANCMSDYSGQPFLDGLSALYDAGLLRLPEDKK